MGPAAPWAGYQQMSNGIKMVDSKQFEREEEDDEEFDNMGTAVNGEQAAQCSTHDIIMSSTSPRYMKASPLVVYSMLIVKRNIKHEGYNIK